MRKTILPSCSVTLAVLRHFLSVVILWRLVSCPCLLPAIGPSKIGKGSKEGMKLCGFVGESCSEDEFCAAFTSLDEALQRELKEEEKKDMGYNIIMLEHALCKIKRLGVESF